MEHLALFALGLALLAVGAGLLTFGSARLDRATGRGPFAVGIVGVAFGPCLAGLALALALVMRQQPLTLSPMRIAVGSLIGSSVACMGLVLGVAVLVRPVAASAKLLHTAMPLAFVAILLFWFLTRNSPLTRVEAGVLLTAFVVELGVLIRAAMRETDDVKAEFACWLPERLPVWAAVLFALGGIAGLVGGAHLGAMEAVHAAAYLKITSLMFGATVAAFGTAVPALVAAVLAARRGRSNLVLGVVVGQVVVNFLFTAGVVAMARPLVIEASAINEAIPALTVVALLLLPVLVNGLRVPRWEGGLLLAGYVGFVALVLTRK